MQQNISYLVNITFKIITNKVVLIVFDRTKKLSLFIAEEAYKEAVQNVKDHPNSPLVKWYLDILDKTLESLENFDLIRCIRQIFLWK